MSMFRVLEYSEQQPLFQLTRGQVKVMEGILRLLKNSIGCILQKKKARHKSALYLLSVETNYMEDRKSERDRVSDLMAATVLH